MIIMMMMMKGGVQEQRRATKNYGAKLGRRDGLNELPRVTNVGAEILRQPAPFRWALSQASLSSEWFAVTVTPFTVSVTVNQSIPVELRGTSNSKSNRRAIIIDCESSGLESEGYDRLAKPTLLFSVI
jgi:hypothetical protein